MGDIEKLLNPNSIAVIGASRDEKKVGHVILKNLLKSSKKVFPVNPKAEKILEQKCYKELLEIPYEIDQIVVAVPGKIVPEILVQAKRKKVKSAIIISSGFSETKNDEVEQRIKKIADESKIKLLGPNTFGYINTKEKINSTFFSGFPKEGKIAFISQSGAIGSAILDKKPKFSKFVAIGNSAQTDFSDFIEYFSTDKETEVITIYMESLKQNRGQRFIEACKKCKKPIIVLKSGKSKTGQKAAQSHTAALASEQGVYSGIFKQCGIVEADSIKQMFDIAKIIPKYPKQKFKKATIITNAGGLGVLTTDACEENKIEIKQLEKSTLEKLNKILPENWSKNNPIDIIGDADSKLYEETLKIAEAEKSDFIIVLLTPQQMSQPEETAKLLVKTKKPTIACFVGGEKIAKAKEFLDKFGIINFDDPKEMCDCLGKITL